jgi:GNAT superfamily N-acetyltransferase
VTKYSIREVDGPDEEETIRWLNELVDVSFPYITEAELENGYWWLAYRDNNPVAFAGLIATRDDPRTGYYKRAGVHPKHRGHGLQIRLMRVRERKARKMGWTSLVSECTNTPFSANNFIKAGFQIYQPESPWAFDNSIYWIKKLA